MKKSTFLTLLILVICIISMSMFFVACNKENTIIGSWTQDDVEPNPYIVIEKVNGALVVTRYGNTSTTDMNIFYDSKEKVYKITVPFGGDSVIWARIKIIDSNTIETTTYFTSRDGIFHKVS